MDGHGVLRLWSLRPQGFTSVVDARIRDVIAPAAATTDGLRGMFVGRRVVDRAEERILASVWGSEQAIDAAARPGALLSLEEELGQGTVERMAITLAVAPRKPADVAPTLLRVFRGRVRDGEMDAYVDAARRGTIEDMDSGAGPLGLFLAVTDPNQFVTVSVWDAWERIQLATGGNVKNPVATRHMGRLAGGVVAHYELLPSTGNRPSAGPGLLAGLTPAD